jgi:hypothetical protein
VTAATSAVVDLDGVEPRQRERRAGVRAADLVARRGVAPLLARAAELVVQRPRAVGRSARGLDVGPQRGLDGLGLTPRLQSRGIEADILGRGGDELRIVEQPAGHRPHAQAPQQRLLRLGRVQAGGDDRAACGLGRRRPGGRAGLDRHPVAALHAAEVARELLGLAGLERQDDHRRPPAQLVAVVPAQPEACRLRRERERARRIGEERYLEQWRHASPVRW